MLSLGIIAAISSAILWAFAQIIEKTAAYRLGNFKAAVIVVSAGILPILILFIMNQTTLPSQAILYSAASGIAFGIGFILFYKSLESQQVSNSSILGLVQVAILFTYGAAILSEPVTTINILATLLIFVGVILVSLTKKIKFNMLLLPAILGNVCWAIYWILFSVAVNSTGQIIAPMLISRAVGAIVTIIAFVTLFKSKKSQISKKGLSITAVLLLAILAGLLDGTGNIIFGVVIQQQVLALGSVFGALIPVIVTLIAYFVYKERLTMIQGIGMVLAVVGALAIALF